jgi:hypothetical protein
MPTKPPPTRPGRSARNAKAQAARPTVREYRYTAATADRHELYQLAVQDVVAEIDFVDATFLALRGRHASVLREDFAGTANTACEWVRRRPTNRSVAVDLDRPTLDWGREHNLAALGNEASGRVDLVCADVRDPGPAGRGVEIALAMNFSYWIFMTRAEMTDYFRSVRTTLDDDGIFFLDFYGGSDTMLETVEKRRINKHFTYHWDQHRYDPISGRMHCKIHFKFPDGTTLRNAFEYEWRLWTLPEVIELLGDAGFEDVKVYWEGTDEDNPDEGNGEFFPVRTGDADPAFICYLVAQKRRLAEVVTRERP